MTNLYPSLISSDLLNLQKTVSTFAPHCAGFHLDIMDGHFVPNLTWGPPFVTALRMATKKQLWVHLMVTNPTFIFERLNVHTNDLVSFHYESCSLSELKELLHRCAQKKLHAGIALKPSTPVTVIEPFITQLGHVLIMSVEPGFSGQQFLPATLHKLDDLVALKKQCKASFSIAIDGGITHDNIKTVVAHGATYIAAASAIFNHSNPLVALKQLLP